MERELDKTSPDTSTLWLAIGLGGFSVVASFVLAIYCSGVSANDQANSPGAQSDETQTQALD